MIPLPDGWALLTGSDAAFLGAMAGAMREHLRRQGVRPTAEVDALLGGLRACAQARRAGRSVPTPSAIVPIGGAGPSATAGSGWLSVQEAAVRIGITDQAVTRACRVGTLRADQPGGRGCAWFVDPASAEEYERRRTRVGAAGSADAA